MEVTLISNDQEEFIIDSEVAEKSEIIKNVILDSSDSRIPLPDIDGKTLSYVVDYLNSGQFPEVDTTDLFSIILASNYLDIKELLDIACEKVATMIKGKTPDEIRKKFNVENDFNIEEEENIKKENEWSE